MKAEEGDFEMRNGSTNSSDSSFLTERSIDERYSVQSKGCEEPKDEWAKMETEINLVLASATREVPRPVGFINHRTTGIESFPSWCG
jgi:hypothetical protein